MLTSSDAISKVLAAGNRPVILEGFPLVEEGRVSLYPSLDPDSFLSFLDSAIIDVLITRDDGWVTVAVEPDSDVTHTTQHRRTARTLIAADSHRVGTPQATARRRGNAGLKTCYEVCALEYRDDPRGFEICTALCECWWEGDKSFGECIADVVTQAVDAIVDSRPASPDVSYEDATVVLQQGGTAVFKPGTTVERWQDDRRRGMLLLINRATRTGLVCSCRCGAPAACEMKVPTGGGPATCSGSCSGTDPDGYPCSGCTWQTVQVPTVQVGMQLMERFVVP